MKSCRWLLVATILLTGVVLCPADQTGEARSQSAGSRKGSGPGSAKGDMTLAGVVSRQPSLTTFAQMLTRSGLDKVLREGGPYTIFAPDDSAFKRLTDKQMRRLMSDRPFLRKTVARHIVKSDIVKFDSSGEVSVPTLWDEEIILKVTGRTRQVEGSRVLTKDLPFSHGVIYIVDAVLQPKKLKQKD